jgi:hypothetical protein
MRKRRLWLVAGVVALVLVAAGMWYFAPYKLFVNRTVNETLPTAAAGSPSDQADPGPVLLAKGTFVSHEHATKGSVQIVRRADGSRVLTIRDLDTTNGPDLRVWLTDQKVVRGSAGWHVFDDGAYVELGRLKGNRGDQAYAIPKQLDLGKYRSVTIWCKRFSVSFGAAELTRAEPM